MNEDYSNLIDNFSKILESKNIDLSRILNNPNTQETNNLNCTSNASSTTETNTNFNIDIEDILKIKNIIEKMNSSQNTERNNFLHSLKPLLPSSKKEKLEQLIKLSSLLTALDLFENKNNLNFSFDLSSNKIIIIILILIIL